MYSLYRIFFILLALVGCSADHKVDVSRPVSVEIVLSQVKSTPRYVTVYGYLSQAGKNLYLYPDKQYANFKGMDIVGLSLQIWYPTEKLKKDCLNTYVSIYGEIDEYLGLLAIDNIVSVSSLESYNYKCSALGEPISHFSKSNNIKKTSRTDTQ